MRRLIIQVAAMLAFALFAVITESVALNLAEKNGVAMSLLAGGGALPARKLAIAGIAMALRLFARIIVPGVMAQALGGVAIAVWKARRVDMPAPT